ncbi:MAG: Lactate utilization protein A [Alphaproteobacteria bacterium MarineAlpha3_Bin5]|nr:glycolate oxidase iron-sulfur subunit [Magnetovibrio sp.]PPR80154.1 MAG: Lactate utilization protein A [Alphaproteobacteria bacterium MarineAlpha3_Bin5]
MQTEFTLAQLADPDIADANNILRKCVHCGLCTATCPTFVISGDELDSPRGRIYLIREMLQTGTFSSKVVHYLDRCLSCLSCTTTCPSGVDYMHLIDYARTTIERKHSRNLADRLLRKLLLFSLPKPSFFRFVLLSGQLIRPFHAILPGRLSSLARMIPKSLPRLSKLSVPGRIHKAQGIRQKRVILVTGCAQQVLRPSINDATIRLLTRFGCEVIIPQKSVCCGALEHHMGREKSASFAAKANIKAWDALNKTNPIDNVVVNTSGCGTMIKDYGWMFRNDPKWAKSADEIATMTVDISQLICEMKIAAVHTGKNPVVVYHSACSMQHGQKLETEPIKMLRTAGFKVVGPKEGHLCCGSAGTYNILQPLTANKLRQRKLQHLNETEGDVIATGNIGCLEQLAQRDGDNVSLPVTHTVELVDWITGGPAPIAIKQWQADKT